MRFWLILTILPIVIISSCSSNQTQLLYPADKQSSNIPLTENQTLKVGVSETFPDGSPAGGTGFIGLYSLHIDPFSSSAEMSPLRNTALTDVLEVVDITNFLTLAPCTNCARIKSVALNPDGNLVLSIGVKHPFGIGDPLKPITGRNRADLHVFNVEGMVASSSTKVQFPLTGVSSAGRFLLNADGYTGYLDKSLDEIFPTNANIHPYILFFDDYSQGNFNPSYPMGFQSVTDPLPSGNLVMAMGCDYDYKDFVFKLDSEMNFIFAIGCTYAVSAANKSQRFSPEYRIPQHNKKSASEIGAQIISNNLKGGNPSSTAQIQISVVDISHGVPVGSALNEMLADSSVKSVILEVPNVMNGRIMLDGSSYISGTGHSPSDPLVYQATITNSASAAEGKYLGLIKVLDSYPTGLNTNPLLNGADGIERVNPMQNPLTCVFMIDEFATYQVFEIEVGAGNTDPICDLRVSSTEVKVNTSILADPGSSNDPDGWIVLYEYDFNYDGLVFDANVSQPMSSPDFGNPVSILMCHSKPTPQIVTIALRVTDNAAVSVICTKNITVNPSPKNIPLRSGFIARDIGVCEQTNKGYIAYNDGQIWVYEPDYSSGTFKHQFVHGTTNYGISVMDVTARGDIYAVSDNRYIVNFERYDGGYSLRLSLGPNYSFKDVAEVDYYYPGYFNWKNGGYVAVLGPGVSGDPTPRNLYGRHTWEQQHAITYFPPHVIPEEAAGKVSFYILVGIEGGRNYDYFWCLEGAPRYEIERMNGAGNFTGVTIGLNGARTDGINGFWDPKDITTDADDDVYVLDLLSTGQPVVKKFRRDGTPVGMFGDSESISGTPLRLDSNNGNGDIHVLHTNGVSIFTPCEIPD